MKDENEQSWVWFLLPVLALGYLVWLTAIIVEASMKSAFDEEE